MIATTILNGSVEAIPVDLMDAHLRHARKGNRLVVWDPYNDLAAVFFEKGDTHIDMRSGNYDLLADHRHEFECEIAAREIIGSLGDRTIKEPAIRILTRLLYNQARSYGSLEEVAENIRTVGHEDVRKVLDSVPSDDAKALKLTRSVMSLLREHADDINPHDPHSRMISVAHWATCEPSSILFVSNARFARPIARVLRKKLEKGLGLFSQTAEIVFHASSDAYDEDPAVQLELALPGTKYRELVIDLLDDFDPPPAKQVAEVIAFSKAVETPDDRPSGTVEKPEDHRPTVVLPAADVPDDLDAEVFRITASSPTDLAAHILDDPAPYSVDSDDADRRRSVRRKQRLFLTVPSAVLLLGAATLVFSGERQAPQSDRYRVTENDMVHRARREQEWIAVHENTFEQLEARRSAQ